MATQLDIKPGTFETISNQEIGTFTLNVWQHIKLDGFNRFLMSNITLKQGAAVIPGSAYELATDTAATAQEAALTGQTLYGQLRVTNVAYTGVTLNISGNNFGSYNSNEAERDLVADAVAAKVAPASDLFIADGEPAIFDSTDGKSIKSDNSGEVVAWDAGTVYNVAGTLARAEGLTVAATGEPLNQNKYPLLQVNSDFWYVPDDEDDLLRFANRGTMRRGGMHPIHNIQSSVYAQNLKIGKKKINGTQYEFHLIHLDGTTVTGNTTLENLLDVGGGAENPFIDLWAPDNLGTRTLIDSQGRGSASMTGGGGIFPTLAEVKEDQFQGHWHENYYQQTNLSGPGSAIQYSPGTGSNTVAGANDITRDPITDGVNGTPRTGTTTHGKLIVEGVNYIIVMVAA